MSAITHRAFSRHSDKDMIRFAESKTAKYEKAELLEKSSGGMSFIAGHELKPGAGILIRIGKKTVDVEGASPRADYLGEVRWCTAEKHKKAKSYRVGVRLFSTKCVLCGKEIQHHCADEADVCEACRGRFCSTNQGKIEACVEEYLLGNVI
jgi:hypothetical protein